MPEATVEVVNVVGAVVEVATLAGPAGPSGANGVVTADQLAAIADEVEAELSDGPDLVLLYENAKV